MSGRIAVGFRVEPELVHWAVVDGSLEAPTLIATDEIRAPHHYSEGQALSHYRDRVLHVLNQYIPSIAAVKYPEYSPRPATDAARRRSRLEGVILEAANSQSIPVVTAALVTIAKHMNLDSAKIAKQYLERDDLRDLPWKKYPLLTREAIMVAVSALGD